MVTNLLRSFLLKGSSSKNQRLKNTISAHTKVNLVSACKFFNARSRIFLAFLKLVSNVDRQARK